MRSRVIAYPQYSLWFCVYVKREAVLGVGSVHIAVHTTWVACCTESRVALSAQS